jgi:hypothetical protein
MRKLFLAIWGINTVALVWSLGAILLYGSTAKRRGMAADMAEIWAGLAAVYIWALFTSKRRQSRKKKRPQRHARRIEVGIDHRIAAFAKTKGAKDGAPRWFRAG